MRSSFPVVPIKVLYALSHLYVKLRSPLYIVCCQRLSTIFRTLIYYCRARMDSVIYILSMIYFILFWKYNTHIQAYVSDKQKTIRDNISCRKNPISRRSPWIRNCSNPFLHSSWSFVWHISFMYSSCWAVLSCYYWNM